MKHVAFALFCAVTGLVFWGPLSTLVSLAVRSDYYSHTIAVPLLAAYLVYRGKRKIFGDHRIGPGFAIPFLLGGMLLLILQRWLSFPAEEQGRLTLAILSVVLFWLGGFALCYGRRAFRAALFPLLLLLLSVPLPLMFMNNFMDLIRTGSADVASAIFGVCGVPVLRDGFYFLLPAVKIEIAKECSGIHSTMALFVLSLMLGYLSLASVWKRIVLVLLIIPIVSLTNGLRIATLTLLAEYVDRHIFNSPLHHDGGVLFFLLAFGLMLLSLRFLSGQGIVRITGSGGETARHTRPVSSGGV